MITHDELPGPVRKSDVRGDGRGDVAGGAVAGRALKDVEKDMILRTLEQMDGNRTKTADIPGIRRRALQLK
ncbi:MAG: helix-turn-helix domain-containing protein [Desulfobacterales bacterium]